MLSLYHWSAIVTSLVMSVVMIMAMEREKKTGKPRNADASRDPRRFAYGWGFITWTLLTIGMCVRDLQECSSFLMCRWAWLLVAVLLVFVHFVVVRMLFHDPVRRAILQHGSRSILPGMGAIIVDDSEDETDDSVPGEPTADS